MKVSESNLKFHDSLIYNSGNQIWMDMQSKPIYSKGYGPFDSNYPKSC